MDIKELIKNSYFHDEIITGVFHNEDKGVLQIDLKYCEWQLEDLAERGLKYKKLSLIFNGVEQLVAYTDLRTLVEHDNSILCLEPKQDGRVLLGLDHFTNQTVDDWFFMEFSAADVDMKRE